MREAISIAVQADVPLLVWGEPGVGKSAYFRSLGETLYGIFRDIRPATEEPAEITGFRLPGDREEVGGRSYRSTETAPPAWAIDLAREGKGLLLIEELSCAAPAVQAAMLGVVLDRKIGDFYLPEGVRRVAIANPPDSAAGGFDLEAPLANRFLHLDWSFDFRSWRDGMISGFGSPEIRPLPENWRDYRKDVAIEVTSFLDARRELVHKLPENLTERGRAWPSPRTWDMLITVLAAARSAGADEDTVATLATGCVGQGAAFEYLEYSRHLDLPRPEDILSGKVDVDPHDRPDRLLAILTALASKMSELMDAGNPAREWSRYQDVIASVAEEHVDIAAVTARDVVPALKRHKTLRLDSQKLSRILTTLRSL